MTRSRSPGAYAMSVSSCAQSVSRRFPARGFTFSDEKSPIQRMPEMMRVVSDSSGNAQISLIFATSVLSQTPVSDCL